MNIGKLPRQYRFLCRHDSSGHLQWNVTGFLLWGDTLEEVLPTTAGFVVTRLFTRGAWCHTIQYTSHQTHTSLSILPISLSLIAIYLRTIIVQGFPIWINRFCVIYDNMISVIHTRQGGISKHRQVWEENKHTPNLKAP